MRYCIIGLGIYGSNLALDLTAMGHEVIGADIKPALVEAIKNKISTAYIIDTTDEHSLSALPLKNVDLVIVAIGENFGASVKTVAILKMLGVPHIYARAIDPLHESILEGFHIDRIVKPEQRAAKDLVSDIALGTHVDSMAVDSDVSVLKFAAPQIFYGTTYRDLRFDKDYGLKLVAATRPKARKNVLGISREVPVSIDVNSDTLTVGEGDILVTVGSVDAYRSLYKAVHPL